MKIKKTAFLQIFISVLFFCAIPLLAQENRIDLFLSGGFNFPNMDDVNNIYHQDLAGYKDVNIAYDLNGGIILNIIPELSVNVSFNYLHHRQNPPAELARPDGDIEEGTIDYRITGFSPGLGFRYNKSLSAKNKFSAGIDITRFIAKLSDDLPEAKTFFDYLHGSSWGFVFVSNIRRNISDKLDVGLELGYRLVNVKKLKIDSKEYIDYSEDIVFTLNGETVDLDFSGPLLRLLFVFKL